MSPDRDALSAPGSTFSARGQLTRVPAPSFSYLPPSASPLYLSEREHSLLTKRFLMFTYLACIPDNPPHPQLCKLLRACEKPRVPVWWIPPKNVQTLFYKQGSTG